MLMLDFSPDIEFNVGPMCVDRYDLRRIQSVFRGQLRATRHEDSNFTLILSRGEQKIHKFPSCSVIFAFIQSVENKIYSRESFNAEKNEFNRFSRVQSITRIGTFCPKFFEYSLGPVPSLKGAKQLSEQRRENVGWLLSCLFLIIEIMVRNRVLTIRVFFEIIDDIGAIISVSTF